MKIARSMLSAPTEMPHRPGPVAWTTPRFEGFARRSALAVAPIAGCGSSTGSITGRYHPRTLRPRRRLACRPPPVDDLTYGFGAVVAARGDVDAVEQWIVDLYEEGVLDLLPRVLLRPVSARRRR